MLFTLAYALLTLQSQDLTRDVEVFGTPRDPISLQASAFEIFALFGTQLAVVDRSGTKWFGVPQGFPFEGASYGCWDGTSQAYRLRSTSGSWRVLRPASMSLQPGSSADTSCQGSAGRNLNLDGLEHFRFREMGWHLEGRNIFGPEGQVYLVAAAQSIPSGEVVLLASQGKMWRGRLPDGPLEQVVLVRPETCVRDLTLSNGDLWVLGCRGSLARVSTSGNLKEAWTPWDALADHKFGDLLTSKGLAPASGKGPWLWSETNLWRWTSSGLSSQAAPWGAPIRFCRNLADTLWCATDRALSWRDEKSSEFHIDGPPREEAGDVQDVAWSSKGVLAATADGIWQRSRTGWTRAAWLPAAQGRLVTNIAVEPGARGRVAWSDGWQWWVDTLPGGGGATGTHTLGEGGLGRMLWDERGRLHGTTGNGWTVWNPTTNDFRQWLNEMGGPYPPVVLFPYGRYTWLGGKNGLVRARTDAFAP